MAIEPERHEPEAVRVKGDLMSVDGRLIRDTGRKEDSRFWIQQSFYVHSHLRPRSIADDDGMMRMRRRISITPLQPQPLSGFGGHTVKI